MNSDLKTLKDFNIGENSRILAQKKSEYFDADTDYNNNNPQFDEMELFEKLNCLKGVVRPDLSDEIIILALKKNKLDAEETMLMLIDEEKVKDLMDELGKEEENKAFIPIIADVTEE